MNEIEILDPTVGEDAPSWPLAPSIDGDGALRFALLDISKRQGDVYLDELEALLTARGHSVTRHRKPTMARPATREIVDAMTRDCDVAVVALAD